MIGPEFRTVFAGVRPARLAVLIDQGDAEWQDTCRRIIECLASTWGGKYSVIVPTDGSKLDTVFWNLLDAFDPDYICEYGKTGLDWKIGSPQEYEKLLERTLREHHPDQAPQVDAHKAIDEALARSQVETVGITPDLRQELKMRLSPFFFEDNVIEYSFQARSEPGYPLTALSAILPHCQHSDRLVIANSDIDGIPPLWIESVLGATYQEQTARIEACGVHIESLTLGSANVFQLMRAQLGLGRGDTPLPDYVASGPFEFSMAALSEYRSVAERAWELPAVVVAGSTLQDFALYFGLSRIRPHVCWLLPTWLDTFKTATLRAKSGGDPVGPSEAHGAQMADALHNAVIARTIKDIDFVSASLVGSELATIIGDLGGTSARTGNTIKTRGRVCGSIRDLFTQPRVAFNTNNFAIPTTQQVLEGKTVGFFPTPKPKGFVTVVPYEHRWITELRVEGLT